VDVEPPVELPVPVEPLLLPVLGDVVELGDFVLLEPVELLPMPDELPPIDEPLLDPPAALPVELSVELLLPDDPLEDLLK
jgi:hypothetical protein